MNFSHLSFETISGKVESYFKSVSRSSYIAVFIIIGIGFLNFGQIATTLIFNNDGLDRINVDFFAFFYYVEIGRWAYSTIYHFFHFDTPIPFISVAVSVTMLTLVIIQLWSILNIKSLFIRVISGSIFLSFPILIHYFFYIGDIEVYSLGMLLTTSSLILFKHNEYKIGSSVIALNIIALGCYPALFSFINTLFLLLALQQYADTTDLKQSVILFTKGLAISLCSLVIYFVITKLLLFAFHLELTDYRGANDTSITGLLLELPEKMLMAFDYFGQLFTQLNPLHRSFLILLFLAFLYYLKPKTSSATLNWSYPFLALAVIIGTVFSTYYITPKSNLYVGFIFGFLPLLMYLSKVVLANSNGYLKSTLSIILILLISNGIKNNNALTLTHQINVESSKALANNILFEIQKKPNYNMKSSPIVFIGLIENNPHYNFFEPHLDISILNGMNKPVGFVHQNRPSRKQCLLRTLNYEVAAFELPQEKYQLKIQEYENLPLFPEKGSIVLRADTIFVHLGRH